MRDSTDDLPIPLTTCWLHWIAVPTGDQSGVMETMGLVHPRPVTFTEAAEIIDEDSHGDSAANPDGMARVYVSPELDGWTLVIGPWCDPSHADRSEHVLSLCTDLSVRYGQAQAYYYGTQGDGSAWLIAQNGTVLRRYCETGEAEDANLTLGDPLPIERARRAQLGLSTLWDEATEPDEHEAEWRWAAFDLAPKIARKLGVCPVGLAADTWVAGEGVIAFTVGAGQDRAAT